jgi:hypothetical protein
VFSALFQGLSFAMEISSDQYSGHWLTKTHTKSHATGCCENLLPSLLAFALRTASSSGLKSDERQSSIWAAAEAPSLPASARCAILRVIRSVLPSPRQALNGFAIVADRLFGIAAAAAHELVVIEPFFALPARPNTAVQIEAETFLAATRLKQPLCRDVICLLSEALWGKAGQGRQLAAFRVIARPAGAGLRRFAAFGQAKSIDKLSIASIRVEDPPDDQLLRRAGPQVRLLGVVGAC